MKVVYVIDGWERTGGIQNLADDVINMSVRRGDIVRVVSLPMWIPRPLKRLIVWLRLLSCLSFDVFHSLTILPSGFFVHEFCRTFNKRMIQSVYGKDVLSSIKSGGLKRKRVMKILNENEIIYCSKSTRDLVKYAVKKEGLRRLGITSEVDKWMKELKDCWRRY